MNKRFVVSQSRVVQRRLRDLRKDAGVTQIDLASRLGKPQSFVAKYEIGERELSFAEAVYVCMAIERDPHALIEFLLDRIAGRRKRSAERKPTPDQASRKRIGKKRTRATVRKKARGR